MKRSSREAALRAASSAFEVEVLELGDAQEWDFGCGDEAEAVVDSDGAGVGADGVQVGRCT